MSGNNSRPEDPEGGLPPKNLALLNSECQNVWDRTMWNFGYSPSFYAKVAVLMISWEAPFDDFKTEDEVNNLAAVFVEKYNFEVSFLKLKEIPRRRTQVQLKMGLAVFVRDHDDEDTLLIIYYAGHGFVRDDNTGQLMLSRSGKVPSEHGDANKVVWNDIENLLDETSSDVLEIMDCRYAGDLEEREPPFFCNGAIERISATSAGAQTSIPGKTSFTSTLTWALNQFLLPENFTATDLMAKIRECPHFPKDQRPVSSPRNVGKIEQMVLGPIFKGKEAIREQDSGSTGTQHLSPTYYVHLDFQFTSIPSETVIEDLANQLTTLRKKGLGISNISWQGVYAGPTMVLGALDGLDQPFLEWKRLLASEYGVSHYQHEFCCSRDQ